MKTKRILTTIATLLLTITVGIAQSLELIPFHFPEDILLMPEGITNELLTKNAQEAVKVCIERGWTLCDRLHIRIWGDKRGV